MVNDGLDADLLAYRLLGLSLRRFKGRAGIGFKKRKAKQLKLISRYTVPPSARFFLSDNISGPAS